MGIEQYKYGRLKQDVSEVLLPPTMAANIKNIDISTPGHAVKRKGFQRAISTDFEGAVKLAVQYTDYDGADVYIVVAPGGLYRET